MIDVRKFDSLGHADHGWLNARHHFSFADYHDPARMGWGAIRVWNDDEIAAKSGFPPHPHRDMEIITYVRSGAITHQDSMGNKGRTGAGDVQVMSAGTGVRHAEYQSRGRGDDPVPDLGADRHARRRAELGRDAIPQGRPLGPVRDAGQRLRRGCRSAEDQLGRPGDGRDPAGGRDGRAAGSIRRATPIWSRPRGRSRSTASAPRPATASPSPARRR